MLEIDKPKLILTTDNNRNQLVFQF